MSWDESDRDKALAWQSRESSKCPGCGTYAAEWDPEAGGHPQAYQAALRVCLGCQQLESAQAEFGNRETKPRGVHAVLMRPEEV